MKIENHFENRLGTQGRKGGFTLVEILIVLVIISILMALLFPAFKSAQERAAQSSCASNMKNIYMAVSQYKLDERFYPSSLAVLLPGDRTVNTTLANVAKADDIDNTEKIPPTTGLDTCTGEDADDTCMNVRGTGYLKGSDSLICSNDDRDDQLISSYGDISTGFFEDGTTTAAVYPVEEAGAPGDAVKAEFQSRYVWNFWGYRADGTAYLTETDARTANNGAVPRSALYDPNGDYGRRNRINNSLSNRYAPNNTIITHCIFHRLQMSNGLNNPAALYDSGTAREDAAGARDIVLRLDGSAKPVDVVAWNQTSGTPALSQWQRQELR
jgi:prepilin-type N-terminal cleavage/methylation domain-containing protein